MWGSVALSIVLAVGFFLNPFVAEISNPKPTPTPTATATPTTPAAPTALKDVRKIFYPG
jgi:hypothetical protein